MKDNGIGLPDSIDVFNTETLGLQLVNILVSQLKGSLQVGAVVAGKEVVQSPASLGVGHGESPSLSDVEQITLCRLILLRIKAENGLSGPCVVYFSVGCVMFALLVAGALGDMILGD